ncbi:alpha/beta fold hydrolase [Nocardioides sp. WS12]|uniref:alpha/beta fold hydrolase n=1 Tax=Nocardioides sp. WS12 TaxID=2486272 RepID=UPI0015FBAA85|nr:alpha/beta fold hydrolase [Nocardioides sp. WS12]
MDATRQTQHEPRTTTVVSGDVRLAVFEYGDPTAETILLVHGWPDTHAVWDAVVPLLAENFHVVTYDTRGHGASPLPGPKELFTLELLGDDAIAVARAVSPDRPVHLVAHDWGSIQLWQVVCRPSATEWFASFTSISGPNIDQAAIWLRGLAKRPTPRNLATLARQAASSSYIYFFLTPRLPEALLPKVGPRLWPRLFKATEGIDAPQPAATFTDDMVAGVRLYRANMLRSVLRPNPQRSTVPLQLVVNSKDIAMTPAMFADAADWTVDLTRVDLDRGHWLPVTDPQLVADLVTSYVLSRGGNDA